MVGAGSEVLNHSREEQTSKQISPLAISSLWFRDVRERQSNSWLPLCSSGTAFFTLLVLFQTETSNDRVRVCARARVCVCVCV